ncbi:MAG: hemolysin family protein [bacterium]
MGEIENQKLFTLILPAILLIIFTIRTVYYLLVFCSPYIVKSYSHLLKNLEIPEYLSRREKYIYSLLILFYIFSVVYFVLALFFDSKLIYTWITLYFVVVMFLELFVKDGIFVTINRHLKLLPRVLGILRFLRFLEPIVNIVSFLNSALIKIFNQDINISKKYFSEIVVYLDDFDWDDYRVEILEKFLAMNDTLVREIMVPRMDIVAFEANKNISEVTATIMKYGYSKYPVYEENIDNIIGVVFLKDMLKYTLTNQGFIKLKDIARIPLIVPESKNLYELLSIMKQNRSSIAIVVDEYGGTSGIVTITDLIQELLGRIRDEHDKETDEENINKLSANEYVVNPKIDIYTLEEYLGVDFPDKEEREYTTLSGLIYTKLGRIPKEGEVINMDNVILKILEIKKNRISKVLVKIGT